MNNIQPHHWHNWTVGQVVDSLFDLAKENDCLIDDLVLTYNNGQFLVEKIDDD